MRNAIRSLAVGVALMGMTAGTARADTFYYPGGWVSVSGATPLAGFLNGICSQSWNGCMNWLNTNVGKINTAGSLPINGPFGTTTVAWGPVTTTPEPATLALLGTGLLGIGLAARRRKQLNSGLV